MCNSFLNECWTIFCALAPWLLLGIFGAGLLHVFLPHGFIHRHIGRDAGFVGILKSTLLGVPLPLCSCGVIPAALGLRKDGASRGASVSFLISTPQTGLDSIFVSAGMIGWPFAIFKVIVALFTGLIGGAFADLLIKENDDGNSFLEESKSSSKQRSFKELMMFSIDDLLGSIWKWIILGVLLSALINIFVPEDWFSGTPLSGGILGMLLVLLFSMPLYVCATASVPIAAALISQGMAPGAALVFLMAGPATNIATIGAVAKSLGFRALIIYLVVIVSSSIAGALLFDYFFVSKELFTVLESHQHVSVFSQVCGGLLALILFRLLAKELKVLLRKFTKGQIDLQSFQLVVLQVQNVKCENCVRKIKSLLGAIKSVKSCSVDSSTGKLEVYIDPSYSKENLQLALEEAGYPSEIRV